MGGVSLQCSARSTVGNEQPPRPETGRLKCRPKPTVTHSPVPESGLPGDSHLLAAAFDDVDHSGLPTRHTADYLPTCLLKLTFLSGSGTQSNDNNDY